MIAKDVFPVYAQYHEDITLAALLSEIEKGFYVDVGANHEEYHSVTRYFYDRGWSGINIEPIPRLIQEFKIKRKRDINLQIAISKTKGRLELRDYPQHDGLSTLSLDSKNDPAKLALHYRDYLVETSSLEKVFTDNGVSRIDFLKIDVEGYELNVLESNDWSKYRPVIVCIEANHRQGDWVKLFQGYGYTRAIYDGLNEYYIENSSLALLENFAERAAVLSHSALRAHHYMAWHRDVKDIKNLRKFANKQDELIKNLVHENTLLKGQLNEVAKLSLKDKKTIERLKILAKSIRQDFKNDK